MRGLVCMAILSTCLVGVTVDSAVVRPWRLREVNKTNDDEVPQRHMTQIFDSAVVRPWRPGGSLANAKINPDSVPELEAPGRDNKKKQNRRRSFRANSSRCCSVGRKVAKRRMSCDINLLEVVRMFADRARLKMRDNHSRKIKSSKISARLSEKIRECSASFPKYFEKCCVYREQYFKHMKKCKKRPPKERKRCRQSIKNRYNKNGGRKKKQKKS